MGPRGRLLRGEGAGDAALLTPPRSSLSGTEVRVLLFNATGDRDAAALLKLLQVRGRLAGG